MFRTRRPRLLVPSLPLALPLAAAIALAGCSTEVVADDPPSVPQSTGAESPDAASSPSATPSDSPSASETDDAESSPPAESPSAAATVTLPAGAVWLSDAPSQASRASGIPVDVTVRGIKPAHATGQFLGCEGTVDVTQYELSGEYITFDGRLAMRDDVPDGVVAEVVILTDGARVSAYNVDATDDGAPFRILVRDVDVLEVQTTAIEGTCGPSDLPYLVFVDSYLTP